MSGWSLCLLLAMTLAACGDGTTSRDVPPNSMPEADDARWGADLAGGMDDEGAGDAQAGDPAAADTDGPIPYPELDPAACRPADPADLRGFEPSFAFSSAAPVLQDKAWFLWSVLQQVPAARNAVASDPALKTWSAAQDAAFREAATSCGLDQTCVANHLLFPIADIERVAQDLSRVLIPTGVVSSHLRPSGRFARHASLPDDALVQTALTEALTTLNQAVQDYAMPRADLDRRVAALSVAHPDPLAFYEPLLHVALDAVAADGRDEATRYEPLASGENAAALARLATLDWNDWRFTAILVPGWGPDDRNTPLSETGREHCDISVRRWQAGLAPFLLLSGGHVHPDRTPYSEAIEMKRYLREAYQVPEEAILVDPYARHTTTNLRNAARVLLSAGVPANKPVLISTDALQVLYISALADRCNRELGYVPYRMVRLLSEEDACFLPDALSLHADARDLLDP